MTIHLLYVIKRTCIRIRPPLPHLQISFFNSLSASSFAIHPMYGILYLDQGLSTWLKAVQQVPVMWRFAWSISKTPLQNKLLRWEFLKLWSSLILASKQLSNWKQNCCCSHFFFVFSHYVQELKYKTILEFRSRTIYMRVFFYSLPDPDES